MAERLDVGRLRPEFREPEFAAVMLALLAIAEEDVRRIPVWRGRGVCHMTLIGWTMVFHVFVVDMAYMRGTHAQALIETLPVPRRTIRDNLRRLVDEGALMLDEAGLYRPTALGGEIVNQVLDLRLRQIRRLRDAYDAYEAARRR